MSELNPSVYDPALRVCFLPINQAYVLMFGDQLIDLDGKYLFSHGPDIVDALAVKGLWVDSNGAVQIKG